MALMKGEKTAMNNLKFKDVKRYIAVCAAPLSICMKETLDYENYWEIGDIPDGKYDELYLYGIGQIQSEFYDRRRDEKLFCYCIEIVLSKTPRFKTETAASGEKHAL